MKKGISPVVATLLTMIIVLVTFVVFSSFAKGSFLQESTLFEKQAEAIGEIPCTRSPDVQFVNTTEGAVYINPKDVYWSPREEVNTSFSAKLSSSCLERLDVYWSYGDGTSDEKNCTYVAGKGYFVENSTGAITKQACGSMNHTYIVNSSDVWTLKDVRLQVYGLRSAFYAEASAVGFVTDPNLQVSFKTAPDISDYSCVMLDVIVKDTAIMKGVPGANIKGLRLDVVDSKRMIPLDSYPVYPSIEEAKLTYRAYTPLTVNSKSKTVQVLVTSSYQTNRSPEVSYTPPASANPKKEIVLLAAKSDAKFVDVWYNSSYEQKWKCASDSSGICKRNKFPSLSGLTYVAVTSGDVDSDGQDEIITLMSGSKSGEIFVFKNNEFTATPDFRTISMDDLKARWSSIDTSNVDWVDIAVVNNVNFNGQVIEKGIVALSNSSLALYEVKGNSLILVNEGTDLPTRKALGIDSYNGWVGLASATVDDSGEDAILALGGNKLFIFKYADYANLNKGDFQKYLSPVASKKWVGLAAGNFDGGTRKDDAAIIAGGGGYGDIAWFKDIQIFHGAINYNTIQLKTDFPNIDWRDITAADINRDGTDELLTLFQTSNHNGYVCMFDWSKLNALSDADWKDIRDSKDQLGNLTGKTNPTCMTISSGIDNGWTSIATGDVGCFL